MIEYTDNELEDMIAGDTELRDKWQEHIDSAQTNMMQWAHELSHRTKIRDGVAARINALTRERERREWMP
jgi:hypothetical protein